MSAGARQEILHATSLSIDGKGLLILGPSGSGKSALALRLIALGAGLIADDRTGLRPGPGAPVAFCPSPAIRGLIEARGLGLLRVQPAAPAPVVLVADLGRDETERLPPARHITLLGYPLPLVLRPQSDHLAEGLLVWIRGGRQE